MLSLRRPHDLLGRAVHRAQIRTMIRTMPLTLALHSFAALFLTVSLWNQVPRVELVAWLAFGTIVALSRAIRAARLRADPDYAREHPTSFTRITVSIGLISFFWWVPPLFWADDVGLMGLLAMAAIYAGLLSGGPLTFTAIPPAALVYLTSILTAALILCFKIASLPLAALASVYTAGLIWAVLANARALIAHVGNRYQLQEAADIVDLLREFGAAGSGGIWETDADLNITHISPELAEAAAFDVTRTVGKPVRWLLDPHEKIVDVSSGMQSLFDHFEREIPFHDIAVPSPDSGQWWAFSGRPSYDEDGHLVGWRGVGTDITQVRLFGSDSVRAARSDPLTGIANRLLVRELLEEALLGLINKQESCALLLVDLDRFKLINDTMGHAIGDQLLCIVAQRLERIVGEGGKVGRLGGDEFAVIWTGPVDRDTLSALADKISVELAESVNIGAANLHVGATIGIAIGGVHGHSEDELMPSADLALYRAKAAGRGGHAFFEPAMRKAAEDHRLLENEVRKALQTNAMRLAYQPIVTARGRRLVAREALLRWRHPVRGDIAPHVFIPVIEDSGLIHQIGDWVIHEACAEAAHWEDEVHVAVNISAAQLPGDRLADTVLDALNRSGLDPKRLELEVTETVFLGEDADTLASLERLRELGVRLVLDDFGQGYSSFGYLSRAHFSKIKIDQNFVRQASAGDRNSLAIIQGILALANGLGVETTAEGVETAEQAGLMRNLGIDQLQGFLYGRPEFVEPGTNAIGDARFEAANAS
ncbi:putative bifunctional diguanylate cyclase/phosphodiesterase [Sphingomicrobium clamense]|uniref:EAL domain-containing protein n=1 Tax=Sphingomicrobium clamense TaxID=2851013 RepID=A0ABS6V710_9SPHN|nr:EAL domain-containing protein [Sphingomicrobium sp. B8]MBW0145363.1 EAL domain-containing protein [Sphingomicrobium sp. B8]